MRRTSNLRRLRSLHRSAWRVISPLDEDLGDPSPITGNGVILGLDAEDDRTNLDDISRGQGRRGDRLAIDERLKILSKMLDPRCPLVEGDGAVLLGDGGKGDSEITPGVAADDGRTHGDGERSLISAGCGHDQGQAHWGQRILSL